MKEFRNVTVVIVKDGDQDDKASLRVRTNAERETVTVSKHSWGNDESDQAVVFPRQYLDDVIAALRQTAEFLKKGAVNPDA